MIETDVAMALKETYQKITQMMQLKIDEYGLTFGLLLLTMRILNNPDASQKELAKEMRFTEGAMSSSVSRLIKLNMLEQIPLESDMRYNRLVVTEIGKSMIDDYKEHLYKKYKDIFTGFNEDELMKLHDFLLKINSNLGKINQQDNLNG
jgi:DNA-binding MarR family transcriptional regulator